MIVAMHGRWTVGESVMERLLADARLKLITGKAADGHPLMDKAERTLRSARRTLDQDPDSAFVLAYDAARQAGTALLAQQGLRPTIHGGHRAVEESLVAQFGTGMRDFGRLRRRRHELEYPEQPDDLADHDEAQDAIERSSRIVAAARQLVDKVGFFGTGA